MLPIFSYSGALGFWGWRMSIFCFWHMLFFGGGGGADCGSPFSPGGLTDFLSKEFVIWYSFFVIIKNDGLPWIYTRGIICCWKQLTWLLVLPASLAFLAFSLPAENKQQPGEQNVQVCCCCCFYTCIIPLGFLSRGNSGCFSQGESTLWQSRYPTYDACWVF